MDCRLQVKALREKVKVESLKLSNPEEPKRFIVVDLREDTCRQIVNSGWKCSRRKKERKIYTSEGRSPKVD
jgi:hypothetical protein